MKRWNGIVERWNGIVEWWNGGMVERAINDPIPFLLVGQLHWACALAIDIDGMVWIPGYRLLENYRHL